MRKFLPSSRHQYDVPGRAPQGFSRAGGRLLEDLGRKMSVAQARTEGRIPSPLSRPYMFYLNLYAKGLRDDPAEVEETTPDPGRLALQQEARATFRGLCAVFALREVLGLEVKFSAVALAAGENVVERVLADSVASAPGGEEHWNPIRFYTVRQPGVDRVEVLAGLSPLTGIYPAAKRPSLLTCLYWYDAEGQRWYDPSSDRLSEDNSFNVSRNPATRRKVVRLLNTWVVKALESIDRPRALEAFGFTETDRIYLRNELKLWAGDLGNRPPEEALVKAVPLGLPGVPSLPFLDLVCVETPADILSDFPIHEGRLLVTRDELLSDGKRIYGRSRGGIGFAEKVADLPSRKDNLGVELGLGATAVPAPYMMVDHLFTSRLTLVTSYGFSDGWTGLSIGDEHFLLPFHPEILALLSPQELLATVRGDMDTQGRKYKVRLRFGEAEIAQTYLIAEEGDFVADSSVVPPETFDLRVFPNFDLESGGEIQLPAADRKYYARVRLAPAWGFAINAFRHEEETRALVRDYGNPVRLGDLRERTEKGVYNPGQVLVITCPGRPSGFYVEGRGLVLVRFPAPTGPRAQWEAGVDFGTSNTCVSYRVRMETGPQILRLPVLTSNLLLEPSYGASFKGPDGTDVHEGARALLDFFYRGNDQDTELTEQDYFPTQFVTRQREPAEMPRWDFDNGLIHFANMSLELPMIWALIEGYADRPDSRGLQLRRDFRVKQDLKWEETQWVEAFMRHLRLQVLMTAARQNAQVGEVRFSYPKAFGFDQKQRFEVLLRRVWGSGAVGGRLSLHSESEAVQNYIVREANEYVVFDVGGGTTDIIAFSNARPVYQTSFKLAAGAINRYVLESPHFRSAFLKATRQALGPQRFNSLFDDSLLQQFRAVPNTTEFKSGVVSTTWLGLLEVLEQAEGTSQELADVLVALRSDAYDATAEEKAAVSGFFLSVTLLLCGISYHAGALLAASGRGMVSQHRFTPLFVDLILTGNGSKLYRMLDHPDAPFHDVMRQAMEHGLAAPTQAGDDAGAANGGTAAGNAIAQPQPSVTFSGLHKNEGRVAPKVSVALGLLMQPDGGQENEKQRVPVANLAGEGGYGFGGGITQFDTQLVQFYRAIQGAADSLAVPAAVPVHLSRFMEHLGGVLRRGSNRGMSVIPKMSGNWHQELLEALYVPSHRQIRDRLLKNASKLVRDLNSMDDEDLPALEPLFVVELAALLDQVRTVYGAGQVPGQQRAGAAL